MVYALAVALGVEEVTGVFVPGGVVLGAVVVEEGVGWGANGVGWGIWNFWLWMDFWARGVLGV